MRRLVRLADLRENEHCGQLGDEEDTTDRDEEPEPVPRKRRARPGDDERRDEREHDEGDRDDEERRLVARQRQHGEDATTVSDGQIPLLLERRHGQTEVVELRPVELRRLLLTRPDDRLARSSECGSRASFPRRSSRPGGRSRARRRPPGTCCGRRSGR